MLRVLLLGSLVMAFLKCSLANAPPRALQTGMAFSPFQVSEIETPSSRATSLSLPAFLGNSSFPFSKATGQWIR